MSSTAANCTSRKSCSESVVFPLPVLPTNSALSLGDGRSSLRECVDKFSNVASDLGGEVVVSRVAFDNICETLKIIPRRSCQKRLEQPHYGKERHPLKLVQRLQWGSRH